MAEGCSNSRWYALQIRHDQGRPSGRAEDRVIRGLNISGIEHFYPTYSERSNGRRNVTIIKSLFPGYLFAKFDAASEQRWHAVSIAGVSGIVSIGLRPASIPDDQITAVRKLLASPMSVTPCPFEPLQSGDSVVIKYGPLMGVEGIVVAPKGKAHVLFVVSIPMLGRSVQATIPREQIQLLRKAAKVIRMPSPAVLPKAA